MQEARLINVHMNGIKRIKISRVILCTVSFEMLLPIFLLCVTESVLREKKMSSRSLEVCQTYDHHHHHHHDPLPLSPSYPM